MRRLAVSVAAVLSLLATLRPAAADTFVLTSGGRLEGELLNPEETPRQNYVIQLAKGGKVTLAAAQVKQVITAKAELTEYEKVRPQYPDTAEAQWKLAEWCRDRELTAQRKTHLQRVIQLDPNHAPARRALGYQLVEGRWKTLEELKTEQGLLPYKGKHKMQQEIELEESKRKRELAENEWHKKIMRWRAWIGRAQDRQARENLTNIDDPAAVAPLAKRLLKYEREKDIRLLHVEALGNIDTPEAAMTLAIAAVDDPSEDVRDECLKFLRKKSAKDQKTAVAFFITRLRTKDNSQAVNRAAIALRDLKDATAIVPLINVLVTPHKETISPGGGGNMSMSFNSNGGIGMGMNQRPKTVIRYVNNQPVLDALVTITGQNFNYDQRAWNTWYSNQKRKSETVDARRG